VGVAALALFTVSAVLWAYLIAALIMPKKSTVYPEG